MVQSHLLAYAAGIGKVERDREIKFDLILCGRHASDSDTALVTPELAEMLGYPHATGVTEYRAEEEWIQINRDTAEGAEILEIFYPAVLSVTKGSITPRYPNIKLKLAANRKKIPVYGIADLGLEPEQVGVKGSLTDVGDSYIPEHNKVSVVIHEATDDASALKLAKLLVEANKI